MLTKRRNIFVHHVRAIKKSWFFLRNSPISTSITILIIGISLTLPGFFWTISNNIHQLTKHWSRGGSISLYLQTTVSTSDQQHLLAQIRALPDVESATLATPDDGLLLLKQQEGLENIMEYLTENPLPAVIEVLPKANVNTPEKIEKLFQTLNQFQQIQESKIDRKWINKLYNLVDLVTKFSNTILILLSIAVIFIISNTLRLVLQHHREEIQVCKWIGASDTFILRPFLYSGIWYGLFGGIIAVCIISSLLVYLSPSIQNLVLISNLSTQIVGLSLQQASLLLILACASGWLAAFCSVKYQIGLSTL